MGIDNSELARVQGNLCVSAYRYLRGLNKEISNTSEAQTLNDFNNAYREYDKVMHNEFNAITTATAPEIAKTIIEECNKNSFDLSMFWERRISDTVQIKYGTFKRIISNVGLYEFTVICEIDHVDYEIGYIEVWRDNWKFYDLTDEEMGVDDVITVMINGKAQDICKVHLLSVKDPFCEDNKVTFGRYRIGVKSYIYTYDYTLGFNSKQALIRELLKGNSFTNKVKEKAYESILKFESLFGNTSEEQFLDIVDVRQDSERKNTVKFLDHEMRFVSDVCDGGVADDWSDPGSQWVYMNLCDGIYDVSLLSICSLEDKDEAVEKILEMADLETLKQTLDPKDIYDQRYGAIVYDIGNENTTDKIYTGIDNNFIHLSHKEIEHWLTPDEQRMYDYRHKVCDGAMSITCISLAMAYYRMCKHFTQDAIAYAIEDEDMVQRMWGITSRVQDFITKGICDEETLKQILYHRRL